MIIESKYYFYQGQPSAPRDVEWFLLYQKKILENFDRDRSGKITIYLCETIIDTVKTK